MASRLSLLTLTPLLWVACADSSASAPIAQSPDAAADATADHLATDGSYDGSTDATVDQDTTDGSDATIPDGWRAIPQLEFAKPTCAFLEAIVPSKVFPDLAWQSCGDGCEVLQVVDDQHRPSMNSNISVAPDGEVLATFSIVEPFDPTTPIGEVVKSTVRVMESSGETLSALRRTMVRGVDTRCSIGAGTETARSLDMSIQKENESLAVVRGWFDPSHKWKWVTKQGTDVDAEPKGRTWADLDDDGGQIISIGNGGVHRMAYDTGVWTPIEVPSSSRTGSGSGDLAVWNDTGDVPNRIRGWSASKGVHTLQTGLPGDTCDVVATPTHVIGLHAGPGAACVSPEPAPALWKMPRAGGPAEVGPALPGAPLAISKVRAWRTHAAIRVNDGNLLDSYVLIVRLSDWAVWRFDFPDGWYQDQRAMAVDDTHVYFSEFRTTDTLRGMRRLRRLELARLEMVAIRL